jgi:hypothetical protein
MASSPLKGSRNRTDESMFDSYCPIPNFHTTNFDATSRLTEGTTLELPSFWNMGDGWDNRPRAHTSESYRTLGHRTASSGRRIDESSRPSSTYSSTTSKYTPLQFENEFVMGIVPKKNQCTLHSPGPIYNTRQFPPVEWPHHFEPENNSFGIGARFQIGRSFIPKTYGADALYYPSETQVRGKTASGYCVLVRPLIEALPLIVSCRRRRCPGAGIPSRPGGTCLAVPTRRGITTAARGRCTG